MQLPRILLTGWDIFVVGYPEKHDIIVSAIEPSIAIDDLASVLITDVDEKQNVDILADHCPEPASMIRVDRHLLERNRPMLNDCSLLYDA